VDRATLTRWPLWGVKIHTVREDREALAERIAVWLASRARDKPAMLLGMAELLAMLVADGVSVRHLGRAN